MRISRLISPALLSIFTLGLISCGEQAKDSGAVIVTPSHGKVDLSKVSLKVKQVKITRKNDNQYSLSFKYTLINKAGATISFTSIFSGKDDLIEVNLSDKNGDPLFLGKRPQEGLTLASARPMLIPKGKFTRIYTVPVMPELREKGDPITVRVRFHAPSRYDELRSSIEAPRVQTPWPQADPMDAAEKLDPSEEDNPLTFPSPEATYPTR